MTEHRITTKSEIVEYLTGKDYAKIEPQLKSVADTAYRHLVTDPRHAPISGDVVKGTPIGEQQLINHVGAVLRGEVQVSDLPQWAIRRNESYDSSTQ